jgi:opacity protein-like surface antigen
LDVLNLLVSGEVFYDNINASTRDFALNDGSFESQDRLKINNRYGVKANVGFAVLPRITPFITYGLASVNYSSEVPSSNLSLRNSKLTPIYGAGLLVDLLLGVSLKASYDYQTFSSNHATEGVKVRSHLGIAKLGVIYNF